VPEGFSATEVGKEIGAHAKHTGAQGGPGNHGRAIVIVEAVLLSIVAVTAAWSGYASAKWGTESSLQLAKANAARSQANRANLSNLTLRTLDASSFNAWFTARIADNKNAERIAIKRFRPAYRVAFDAWIATHPDTNPNAPAGPQYMREYKQPLLALSHQLDREADAHFAEGSKDGGTSDDYVRTTIFLASVLFLVGISTHFPLLGARYALIAVGAVLLIFAFSQLIGLPKPPS
jgi:hypothetical protein